MYQYDDPTAVSTMPSPATAGTPGFFTDGNPSAGSPATILRSDFMNAIMMELLNVVVAAGLTPSKTNDNQLLAAINSLIASSASGFQTTAAAATSTASIAASIASTASSAASATAAVSAAQLGISQTWQQFTVGSTRVLGTTYTNTGVRPIAIAFDCNGNTSGNASLTIGGLVVGSSGGDTTNGAAHSQIFGIVPPGGTYSVTSSRATNNWFELR